MVNCIFIKGGILARTFLFCGFTCLVESSSTSGLKIAPYAAFLPLLRPHCWFKVLGNFLDLKCLQLVHSFRTPLDHLNLWQGPSFPIDCIVYMAVNHSWSILPYGSEALSFCGAALGSPSAHLEWLKGCWEIRPCPHWPPMVFRSEVPPQSWSSSIQNCRIYSHENSFIQGFDLWSPLLQTPLGQCFYPSFGKCRESRSSPGIPTIQTHGSRSTCHPTGVWPGLQFLLRSLASSPSLVQCNVHSLY